MAQAEVKCIHCQSSKVFRHGLSAEGSQRYRCCRESCRKSFLLAYRYQGCLPAIKEKIVKMVINGSGIRDTARVLSISVNTVIGTIKKKPASSSALTGNIIEKA